MDDETLGCGGLIQRFDRVKVVFVTERSLDERFVDGKYVAYSGDDRAEEMKRAAELLGFEYVRLGYPVHGLDGVPLSELIRKLEDQLDGTQLLLTPGPTGDEDHEVVRRAVRSLRRPHRYAGSWMEYFTWGAPHPYDDSVVVPLAQEEIDTKIEAIRCYGTQVAPGGAVDPLYMYGPESMMNYACHVGRLVHASYAEAYEPRRLVPNKVTSRLFRP